MKHHRDSWYIKLVYDAVLDDYRLADLPAETRWVYLQVYCLVGKFGENGTWARDPRSIADRLRCDLPTLRQIEKAGLIEISADGLTVSNWSVEQIGASTPRTQKHRAKVLELHKRSGNVPGTVPREHIP